MPRNALIGAVVTFFLAAAIGAGVYLTQNQQIFKSEAFGEMETYCDVAPDGNLIIRLKYQGFQIVDPSSSYYNFITYDLTDNPGGAEVGRNTFQTTAGNQYVVNISAYSDPNLTPEQRLASWYRPTAGRTYQVEAFMRYNDGNQVSYNLGPAFVCADPRDTQPPPPPNPPTPVSLQVGACYSDPGIIEAGQSATWSASGVSGGDGSYSYYWFHPSTGYSSTSTQPSVAYTTAGTYPMNLKVTSAGQEVTISCRELAVNALNPIPNGGTCPDAVRSCVSGTRCLGGKCRPNDWECSPEYACSGTLICQNNRCVGGTGGQICTHNQSRSNDAIGPEGQNVQVVCNETGTDYRYRPCTMGCSPGYFCDGAHCVAQPACAGKAQNTTCPGGICNGNGACIPLVCTPNQPRANDATGPEGQSVQVVCNETGTDYRYRPCTMGCSNGYFCDGAHCIAEPVCSGKAEGFSCGANSACDGHGKCIPIPATQYDYRLTCNPDGSLTTYWTRPGGIPASRELRTIIYDCGNDTSGDCSGNVPVVGGTEFVFKNLTAGAYIAKARSDGVLETVTGGDYVDGTTPYLNRQIFRFTGGKTYQAQLFQRDGTIEAPVNGVKVDATCQSAPVACNAACSLTSTTACSGTDTNGCVCIKQASGNGTCGVCPAGTQYNSSTKLCVPVTNPTCNEASCNANGQTCTNNSCACTVASCNAKCGAIGGTCSANVCTCNPAPPDEGGDDDTTPPDEGGDEEEDTGEGPLVRRLQTCQDAIGGGTQYCEGHNNSAGRFIPDQCWTDDTKTAEGCRYTPSSLNLSCAPDPDTVGVGGSTIWRVRYSQTVPASPTFAFANDPNITIGTSPTIRNGQFEVTAGAGPYSTPGVATPTVTLKFGSAGQTAPLTCTPLSIGLSTVRASINTSATDPKINQEVTLTANAVDGVADPNAYLTSVKIYVAKLVNGAVTNLTADECGVALDAGGRCFVGGRDGLFAEKTVTNIQTKWTPKKTGKYLAYVEAVSSTGANCTGSRETGKTPCGNTSNRELNVAAGPATISYRITDNAADWARCPLAEYKTNGTKDLLNGVSTVANCPPIHAYGTNPSVYLTNFPTAGEVVKLDKPGPKTFFVQFIKNDGGTNESQATIQLVPPAPVTTSVACSIDLTGKGLNLSIPGRYFGTRAGTVSVNGSQTRITKWGENLITANIALPNDDTGSAPREIVVTRADGEATEPVTCQVGVSLLQANSKLFCRSISTTDQTGVDLVLVEATPGAKPFKAKVTIDKDGLITGANVTLQENKCYKLSLKPQRSVRRLIQFQAGPGTTTLSDLKIPIGDIAPQTGDGKINSFDRSEIIRQWSAASSNSRGIAATQSAGAQPTITQGGTTVRTGDFNGDGLINSFDWSCMMLEFNAENDPEAAAGPIDFTKNPELETLCGPTATSP